MSKPQTIAFQVTGRVQGVGFRHFTVTQARLLQLTGWVRNNPDGSVSGEACGTQAALEAFQDNLRQGPRFAQVTALDLKTITEPARQYNEFSVAY